VKKEVKITARGMTALAHPTRLQMIAVLREKEMNVHQIADRIYALLWRIYAKQKRASSEGNTK